MPFAMSLSVDNRLERWIDSKDDQGMLYASFKDQFGGDELILVAYSGRPIFDEEALEIQVGTCARAKPFPRTLPARNSTARLKA